MLAFTLTACQTAPAPTAAPPSTPASLASITPPIEEPAPTAAADLVYILPSGSGDPFPTPLLDAVEAQAHERGWSVRLGTQAAPPAPERVALQIVFGTGPNAPDAELPYADRPTLHINLTGEKPSQATSLTLPPDASARQALLAGYLAALVTPEWRVAALSSADEQGLQGVLLEGARFLCGLCRPTLPPYALYPLAFQIETPPPPDALDQLIDEAIRQGVETIALTPAAVAAGLVADLSAAGFNLVGMASPDQLPAQGWVATVRYSPEAALPEAWSHAVSGQPPESFLVPLSITDRDPVVLTEGRLRLALETAAEIDAGLIGPAP